MASAYKVLGQVAPPATTLTTLYTCPAATQAVISTIVIATRAAGLEYYRLAVRPGGAAIANQHYVAYDVTIAPTTAQTATLGVTLGAGDVVSVYATSALLSFSAFGSEIT